MVSMLKMPRRWEDGTYTFGFGGLSTDTKPTKTWDDYVIANGSSFFEIDTLGLYFYDKDSDSWIKAKVEAGPHIITSDNITAEATVDSTSGTPACKVQKSTDGTNVKFTFDFSGLKGEKGDKGDKGATGSGSGGDIDISDLDFGASVDDTTGTPKVEVLKSQNVNTGKYEISFRFTGLKGEKGDKGDAGAAGASTKSIDTGQQNTVNEAGAAIGHGNTVGTASLAVGHVNKAGPNDSVAIGNRVVSDANQLVVGHCFAGVKNAQGRYGYNFTFADSGVSLPFIVASNSDETSHDFLFAVPRTYNDDGGIIIQGKNGASKAYYLLKIIDGNMSITNITKDITFEAGT